MNASKALWAAFLVYAGVAIFAKTKGAPLAAFSPMSAGKAALWAALLAFTAYSVYCTSQEDLFATIREVGKLHWGRQIGLDLYIGLSLVAFVVYLNERSALIALVWLVPFFLFGNLATLLYVALSYDELVAKLFQG